jgi:hypothetical protein
MKSALVLFALLTACGGSVESTPTASDSAPVCAAPSGRYSWVWTKKNGDCAMDNKTTTAPAFECNAQPLYAEQSGDRCLLTGDIVCPNEVLTVACSTTGGETIVCDAAVTSANCSGEYTLTMRSVD